MNNGDYIPLDQEVIDQEVAKMGKKRNEVKSLLRDESRNAGGNFDIIVFSNKRIIKALDELGIFWTDVNGEIYANRHEIYDVLAG